MGPPRARTTTARLLAAVGTLSVLLPGASAGVGFRCAQVVADGVRWDLSPLAGPHAATHEFREDPKMARWTFTLDLCGALKDDSKVDDRHKCPPNTRVCAIKTIWDEGKNDTAEMAHWVAIAGDFGMKNGRALDVTPTRLKTSASNADRAREGVRLELLEGRDPFDRASGVTQRKQKAIVEMLCDRGGAAEGAADADAGLTYVSYGPEDVRTENWDVLRLEWRTKYACEDAADTAAANRSWGFFTWIILILFLSIATYIVYGSWINYSRYGARGFDAVPHADTLRDIPFMIKDVVRKLQGGGSRGGYSAV